MLTLVTGATGLVGNNVVRKLTHERRPVRALVRKGSSTRSLEDLPIEIARGDVRDPQAVAAACEGVKLVIHSAGWVHIGRTGIEMARTINVDGARNVAEAARAAGARMVQVSSVDALGLGTNGQLADECTPHKPSVLCPYVLTKAEAETAVLEQVSLGLDAVIVNPNFVLGPWDWKPSSGRMLLQVAAGVTVLAPSGGNDFCDARDIATGILLAAEKGQTGRRYILTGESLSYFDAWKLFAEVTGGRKPFAVAPPWMQSIGGWFGDAWGRVTRREPDVNSAAVEMAKLPHHFSAARAQKELGYTCRPAREAAEAAWEWFRRYGYA